MPALIRGDRAGDLAGHEGLAAAGRLVVEQDAVDREHAVGLAVVPGDPVAVDLRGAVGRARVERRVLVLRGRRGAEHLRGGRLVELGTRCRPCGRPRAAGWCRRPWCRRCARARRSDTRTWDCAAEVVDLVRLDLAQQRDQARAVGEVAVVQEQLGLRVVRVTVQVVDAGGVERGARRIRPCTS